jgi:hypothetical protein
MSLRLVNLVFAALALVSVAGCSTPDSPAPAFPDIRFSDSPPIRLDAASIDVVDQFQPSFRRPFVEQDFPVPPQRALHNWVQDRLAAGDPGSANHIRVTILDASVKDVKLAPTASGLAASFTTEQSDRFDAHVAMSVDIIDGKGLVVRTAKAEAHLSRSIAENTTLNERDQVWYQLTEDITANLGRAIQDQIIGTFSPYILQ